MKLLFKLSFIFTFICILSVTTSKNFVSAQTTSTVNTTRIEHLKTRADAEIDRRIGALNNLITKVSAMKRLSADQKSSFTTQIQNEISSLNTLKTKISGDTDLPTLRTDVQSIISSYRVFALFLPQITILSVADRILTTVDKISPIVEKLQTRIQTEQTNGNNVTNAQTSLTDMHNKLNDAKTQANTAITTATPLAPTGYPGNKTTLQSTRTMLQAAYQDLKTVHMDAESIIQALKAFKKIPIPTHIIPSTSAQ